MGQAYGEIVAVPTPKNELIENAECQIVIKVFKELKIESLFFNILIFKSKTHAVGTSDSEGLRNTGGKFKFPQLTPRLSAWPLRGHKVLKSILEDILQLTKSKMSLM